MKTYGTLGLVLVVFFFPLLGCQVPDVPVGKAVDSVRRQQAGSNQKTQDSEALPGGGSKSLPEWSDGAFTGWALWLMASLSQSTSWLLTGNSPQERADWERSWQKLCHSVHHQGDETSWRILWWRCQSRGPQHWQGWFDKKADGAQWEQTGWSQFGTLGLGQWELKGQAQLVQEESGFVRMDYVWQGLGGPFKIRFQADGLLQKGQMVQGRWVFEVYQSGQQPWRYATAQWVVQELNADNWRWRIFWNYKPPFRWMPGEVLYQWRQGRLKVQAVDRSKPQWLEELSVEKTPDEWTMPAVVKGRGDWEGVWAFDRQERFWIR